MLFTMFLSWINYHLSAVLDVVQPGSTIRCTGRCCALCMKDAHVQCACQVRICADITEIFQRIYSLLYLTYCSFIYSPPHPTYYNSTRGSLCKVGQIVPCLFIRKMTPINFKSHS